jgi:hypothetical protein
VCRAKCSSIGTNEELKEMNRKKAESPTLPMSEDMIVKARPMVWEGQTWDGPGMVSKAIWLCLGIGFNFGARISQLTLAPKKKDGRQIVNDHCLRNQDVKFYCQDSKKTKLLTMRLGGEEVRNFLRSDLSVQKGKVLFVEMPILTGKTVRRVMTYIVDIKRIGRSGVNESTLLDDLCEWMVHSGTKVEDEMLCRYDFHRNRTYRKVIMAKEVNAGIKRLASSLNLPPQMFSSKSMRSGLASQLKASGASRERINQVGGWTQKSNVAEKHYTHRVGSVGALAMSSDAPTQWSVSEIRHLVNNR